MGTDDFWLLGENGFPETFIEAAGMTAHASRIVSEIVSVIDDPEAVAAVIASEVMALGAPENVKLLLAVGVIDQLASGALQPLMAASQRVIDTGAKAQEFQRTRATENGDLSPESESRHV